ncbi:MAG: restriction endonuclease subunit S [Magnetococcales bacterium]|nr:restriction endonuclease subunit S [Magnetococcales bacterium]NGZ28425.1 restriction endonuclease subunit S [Magnetococcales bacterium]
MSKHPPIDIRPDHLQTVLDILKKHVPHHEVWAFGSRVKWTAKEFSDLDLCVISHQPLDLGLKADLLEDFSESDLPWKVDVVDWATTSESFRKIIEGEKVVVQRILNNYYNNLNNKWILTKIEDIAASHPNSITIGPFGSRMKADLYVQSGVRVIRGNNISRDKKFDGNYVYVSEKTANSLSSCCLKPGDLVFPHRGNIGTVGITPDDGNKYILSTSLMKLSPCKNKVDSLYLMYFFRSPIGRASLLMNASQVGTPGIATPLKSLRNIQLLLPPISLQNKIASLLGALDDRITLLREINGTLEAIAQALFKSWFIDFDPVHAKQQGLAPEGMDEATADLFPDNFEESELGLIPKGWRVGSLSDVALLNPESWTAKSHPYSLSYIDLSNTKDNIISNISEYLFDNAPSRARRVLRSGDTIIGTVRPGNRSFAFIYNPIKNLTASTGFAVLRPKEEYYTELIFLTSTQKANIEYLAHLADGGAYPAVRPEEIMGIKCILSNNSIMEAFHNFTSPLLIRIMENNLFSQTLTTLRDTLLPRLISGQLRLPEVEETP